MHDFFSLSLSKLSLTLVDSSCLCGEGQRPHVDVYPCSCPWFLRADCLVALPQGLDFAKRQGDPLVRSGGGNCSDQSSNPLVSTKAENN